MIQRLQRLPECLHVASLYGLGFSMWPLARREDMWRVECSLGLRQKLQVFSLARLRNHIVAHLPHYFDTYKGES